MTKPESKSTVNAALQDWLDKHNARCMTQHPFGSIDEETHTCAQGYITSYLINGRIVWVRDYGTSGGWDIFTGQDSNSVKDALEDAERRLGLRK